MRDHPSTARVVSLLALGYLLLGAAGLLLAIPPGYASPVFPAAGLALSALLLFGPRAWPGVWLGSVILNASHAALAGHLSATTLTAASVIATGATLQALAGRLLVTRWQGQAWREMEREQDAFSFMLLGGVMACAVSATLSVGALAALGIIDRAEFGFTWWTWYVGDTLGVVVFAPLAFTLLVGESALWRERRRTVGIPMVLALAFAALAFGAAARWEAQAEAAQLGDDGKLVARRIGDRLITQREVLASLRNFIEATPAFTFAQFEQFTRLSLRDNDDVFALSFDDVVTSPGRADFEQQVSRLSPLGSFQITERDAERRLVRAPDRPEYVAVRYIVPLVSNQAAVGYDILSEPVRREAIEQARASGGMTVTAPIRLVQEQKERVGVLELMPVRSTPRGGSGEQPRIVGFAVAVIKVDELVEIATRGHVPPGLVFEVTDPQAPADRSLLYRSGGWDDQVRFSDDETGRWSTELRAGQRPWRLAVAITQDHRQQHRPWLAWVVGVAGLAFAALLQVLMLGMTGRSQLIQRKNDALRASEERYQRVFNESPLPMWLYELGSYRFLMVNDRAVAHYGWTREAFLEMRLPDLMTPGEQVAPLRVAQAGHASRHLRRDGSEIDVVVRASPARFGGVEAALEVVEDVTEGRAVQERLLLADRVFENAGSSIVVTDADATAISCNPAFTTVTGYSESEIRGQNMRILGSGRHPPEFFRAMWRSLLEEHQWRGEIWNRRKNGDVFLEWLVIQAVRGPDGATTHYVGSFVDITERRALQEQLAIASRLAAMGTLVAGVAHEINNPLAGVMGAQGSALEELREILDDATRGKPIDAARLGPQLRELVETLGDAQSGSDRIARIVRDLSLLGRPDTQRTRVRLIDVVEEAMRWLPGSVARSAAIQVENGGAPDVEASAGQLAQVLINLVTNGAKAVPRGKQGLVTIRLGPGSRGMARLQVIDNGDGIDPEVLKRIFDPFFTTRRLGEGTGLGLPICHSIVTAHGGSIEVESRVGEGTTFTVELPAVNLPS